MVYELTMSLKSSRASSSKPTTKTVRRQRTLVSHGERIVIPQEDMYKIMYTTDLELIQKIIDASPQGKYIDPEVILRINQKAHELSRREFNNDPDVFDPDTDDFEMLLRYQLIVDPNPAIFRILRKKTSTDDDQLKISLWVSGNHSWFCDDTKSPVIPYVIAPEDYIL
jgi:hypothetical protein